jgi:ABC-type bacteriocin/lantibiotic exporter with double-glycine peptidase domain
MKTNDFKKYVFILRGYKLYFLILFFLFLISSLVEFISLGLMIPLLLIIFDKNQFINNSFIYNDFIGNFSSIFNFHINNIIFLVIFFLFSKYILILFTNYIIPKFAFSHQKKIRLDIAKNFFFSNKFLSSKDLIQLSIGTLSTFTTQFLIGLLRFLSNLVILISITIFLIIFNPSVTLPLFFLFFISFLIYKFFFKNIFNTLGEKIISSNSEIIKKNNEIYKGLHEIKIYKKFNFFLDKIAADSKILSSSETSLRFLISLPRVILEILFVVIIFLILLYSYFQNDLSNSMVSVGIYGYSALRILPSLNELITTINIIRFSKKSVDDIFNHLIAKSSQTEKKNTTKSRFNTLELKNISFSYPSTKNKIINNFSIKIQKGDMIGVIGDSGKGKSTLIKIILGVIKPKTGILKFNNNINFYKDKIQSVSSYIPQDNFILEGSIRDNISLENYNPNSINDNKLLNSIDQAGLKGMIDSFKTNLNFQLKENGSNISGGQKQRISIARAFYHDRELLFLDESTSSLDLESENKILDDLRSNKNVTKFIISHRKNIFDYCNIVLSFHQNNIINIIKNKV